MSWRYLGLVLLVWFPGMLHASSASQSCHAPRLTNGYFVPERTTFRPEEQLTYGCDKGYKPAVVGWWGTVTCQDGKWSPMPQCISEKDCLPITIPNSKPDEKEKDYYKDEQTKRIYCATGYEHKGNDATAKCQNGTWSSVPVCERGNFSCGEPPRIPHAVILQHYQDLFPVDSEVEYQCEDGYALQEGEKRILFFCTMGVWRSETNLPTCRKITDKSGPKVTETGLPPRPGTTDNRVMIIEISNCGEPPIVPNGEIIQRERLFLKYQCGFYYKRVGPDTVVCYTNGMWSPVPTCKAAFCSVNTAIYPELEHIGVKQIRHGDTTRLKCVHQFGWVSDNYSVFRCSERRATLSKCCGWFELKTNLC